MRLIPIQRFPTLYRFAVVLYNLSCYCSLRMLIWFIQVRFIVLYGIIFTGFENIAMVMVS